MSVKRRLTRIVTGMLIGLLLILTDVGHVCASVNGIRTVLAPSGVLRVGLYPGTPTSVLYPDIQSQEMRGVGYDLGKAIADRLGVPYERIVFKKNADVLDAVTAGRVDMAFTNATALREKDMDFGPTYLEIELGYLVPQGSRILRVTDIDVVGLSVGVTAESSSDGVLSRDLKFATVVRAVTITSALDMLKSGHLDAFATNKATLFEMAEKLPGSTVLDGRWGVERHAIAMPKGRALGLAFVTTFTRDAVATGQVNAAVARAGLRGVIVPIFK